MTKYIMLAWQVDIDIRKKDWSNEIVTAWQLRRTT